MRWAWLLVAGAIVAFVIVVVTAGGGSNDDKDNAVSDTRSGSSASGDEAKPKPKKVSGPHDDPVPILMYHVITDPPASAPYTDLYVSADSFRGQIDELARRGYHGVTLDQVDDYWRDGYTLPTKPIVVSFDDGYDSQYRNALPVLRKQDWPGVLNLELRNMRKSWGLGPEKIKGLIAAGWEIDSHTINHPDVSTLDEAGLQREIGDSRKQLQRQFGVPANFFCYPAGRYDDAAIAAVRRAGYKGATTTEPGLGRPNDMYRLARVRVNRGDSPSSVADQLD